MKKILFMLLLSIVLCSCAQYVTIGSKGGIDNGVNITAVGEKNVYEHSNVALPYKMKTKELPLRVAVESPNNLYEDFTIDYELIESGVNMRMIGYLLGTVSVGVGTYCLAFGAAETGLPILGASLPFIAITAFTPTMKPSQKTYYLDAIPITKTNDYRLKPEWGMLKEVLDVYTLLDKNEYKLARTKATYLLGKQKTGELYYLRGLCNYNLSKYKKALPDFKTALNYKDATNMKSDIWELINASENELALRAERRRQQWSVVAAAFASAAEGVATSMQTQRLQQSNPMGVSNLSGTAYLLDPNYIKVQYLQETNNGATMTFEQWLHLKAPASSTTSSDETSTEETGSTYSSPSSGTSQKACTSCKTDGKCPVCKGLGKSYSGDKFATGYMPNCDYCKGSGKCPTCGGTGWR